MRGCLGKLLKGTGIISLFFIALGVLFSLISPQTEENPASVPTVPTYTPTPQPTYTPTSIPSQNDETSIQSTGVQPTDIVEAPTLSPPTATPTPTPIRVSQDQLIVSAPLVNLRGGPGTEYQVLASVPEGTIFDVVGKNPAGDWYKICCIDGQQAWIYASLVQLQQPDIVPVVVDMPTPPVPQQTPTAVLTSSDGTADQPFTCIGGCAVPPDPSCAIKGNVNSKGEKIYHTPGSRYYDRTDIKPEEGDRWFCTEQEARDAGFRPPKR